MYTAIKPPARKPVLAFDKVRWVRAMWVPKYSKEQNGDGDDDFTDYSEADDTYYWPEGWYEVQGRGRDAALWFINAVTHWQELPPKPTASPE